MALQAAEKRTSAIPAAAVSDVTLLPVVLSPLQNHPRSKGSTFDSSCDRRRRPCIVTLLRALYAG